MKWEASMSTMQRENIFRRAIVNVKHSWDITFKVEWLVQTFIDNTRTFSFAWQLKQKSIGQMPDCKRLRIEETEETWANKLAQW